MPLGNFCTIKEKQRIRLHPVGKDVDDRCKKQVKQDAISITHEIMKVKSLKTMFRRMVVFLVKGPISERYESLRGQLELLYGQEPATFLHAYTCLQLAYTTRQPTGAILQDVADKFCK
ncbi:hypothetical protein L2E82_06991 [Cichorium intybus]|uniref:Uncharacterized protein n=1 Tax=Cichorium intybus TaxID=13427 RepID=A0ACB9G3L7_CICIN|nr:hypothetical protein L2E82_06991 [Cichorium intybus]